MVSRAGLSLRASGVALLLVLGTLSTAAPAVAAVPAVAPAPDPWLDPSFGNQGTVRQHYAGELRARVAGSTRAPDGDLVLALEPAHVVWGCCNAEVGGWSLARLAADGTPRAGFGEGGLVQPVLSALPGTPDSFVPNNVAVDPSDRILLVGQQPLLGGGSRPVVMRRSGTGGVDNGFGTGGIAVPAKPSACPAGPDELSEVLPDAAGSMLVLGHCSGSGGFVLVVWRLLATGAADTAFGAQGMRQLTLPASVGSCCSLDAQRLADGRLVVGMGTNPAAVVRLLPNGAPDPSFGGGDGIALAGPAGGAARILALADGRVLFDHGYATVSRLLADGSVDTGYGDAAVAVPDPCGYPTMIDLAGTPERTVVATQCLQGLSLSALDATGQPDTDYGIRPTSVRSSDSSNVFYPGKMLLPDPAGLIVIGSDSQPGVRVERRGATGALDGSFGVSAGTHLAVHGRLFSLDGAAGVLDHHGRLVTAVSASNRGIADEGAVLFSRFLPDGGLDPSFGVGGTRLVESGGHAPGQSESIGEQHVLVAADDSVIDVAAWRNQDNNAYPSVHDSGLLLTRLTPLGAPDPAVGPGGSVLVPVADLSEAPLGGVSHGVGGTILVGLARQSDDGERAGVLRLTASGAIDTSYGAGGFVMVPDVARSGSPGVLTAGLPDGGVVLSWREFSTDGSSADDRVVARIGSSGARDSGFGTGGKVRQAAESEVLLAATESGKVLLAWTVRKHPAELADYAADIHVRRLTLTGQADPAFGSAGAMVIPTDAKVHTVASDKAEALAAAGERPLVLISHERGSTNTSGLVRVTARGHVDTSFGTAGTVVTGHATANLFSLGATVLVGDHGAATVISTTFGPRPGTPADLVVNRVVGSVIRLVAPASSTTLTGRAVFGWHGAAVQPPYRWERRTAGAQGKFGGWASSKPTASGKVTVKLTPGKTTCVRVRGANGAVSQPSCVTAPLTARSLKASKGWTTVHSTALYGHVGRRGTTRGSTLKLTGIIAHRLSLVATRCPGCGAVDVFWNGKRIKHVSLAGHVRHRLIIPLGLFSRATKGTLLFRVTTAGRPVVIEGVAAWRDDLAS
ncbi:MAG: hypothetical protein QOI76_1310 [Frankiales bacterium]|nr:hypothetical protein [Frankiales bacterium]